MPRRKTIMEMSIEELERKYKVKAKRGKIGKVRGNYYLSVGGRRKKLDPSLVISPKPLDQLVRTSLNVRVIFTKRVPSVIIPDFPKTIRCYFILCYYPAPFFRSKINKVVRTRLIREMVMEGTLPRVLGTQLARDVTAGY